MNEFEVSLAAITLAATIFAAILWIFPGPSAKVSIDLAKQIFVVAIVAALAFMGSYFGLFDLIQSLVRFD